MLEHPSFFDLSDRDQRNAIECEEISDWDDLTAYAFGSSKGANGRPSDGVPRPRWRVVKGTDRPKRGLFTTWVRPLLVDADFLALAERAGWTGVTFEPADIEPRQSGEAIRAWVMRCQSVVDEKWHRLRSETTYEYDSERVEVTGDPVEWSSWDGSDIVALRDTLCVFVSETVRDQIIRARFTNISLRDISTDHRMMIDSSRLVEG